MSTRNFRGMLEAKWAEGKFVCVGLDPDWDKIPKFIKVRSQAATPAGYSAAARTLIDFCIAIACETKDLVCAYKPNAAFFESMGPEGLYALGEIIRYVNQVAPEVPVIYDAKRGDIGNTNNGYVKYAFDLLGADAITVHPYLGREALQPFLDCKDKGVIVLCRTSNKGAGEFQDLPVFLTPDDCQALFCRNDGGLSAEIPNDPIMLALYRCVAHRVANHWNNNGNCAIVVGATYPTELAEVRSIVGDLPILIPGIGAQGGDLEKLSRLAKTVAAKG